MTSGQGGRRDQCGPWCQACNELDLVKRAAFGVINAPIRIGERVLHGSIGCHWLCSLRHCSLGSGMVVIVVIFSILSTESPYIRLEDWVSSRSAVQIHSYSIAIAKVADYKVSS